MGEVGGGVARKSAHSVSFDKFLGSAVTIARKRQEQY